MIRWGKVNWNGERATGEANWRGENRQRGGTGDQVRRKAQIIDEAERGTRGEGGTERGIGQSRRAPRGRKGKGAAEMEGRESSGSRRKGARRERRGRGGEASRIRRSGPV